MNRRHFLRGILQSVTAGTALVTLASAKETQFLTVQQPVALGNLETNRMPSMSSPEVYMRHHGVFLCVGLLKELRITTNAEEIVWDGQVVMMPGLKRGEFSFDGHQIS